MRTIVLTLIVLACGVAIWFLYPKQEPAYMPKKVAPNYLYNFEVERASYALEFFQDSELLEQSLGGMHYNYELFATLNIRVLEQHPKHLWLGMQLSDLSLNSQGLPSHLLQALKPYYGSIFLLKIAPNGKVLESHFNGAKKNFVGLEQLSSLLSLNNEDKKVYKETQKDSLGEYEAFYQKDNAKLLKQKKSYLDVYSPQDNFTIDVTKSSYEAVVSKNFWLDELWIDESLFIRDETKQPFAKNTNFVFLEQLASPTKSLELWDLNKSVQELLGEFKQSSKKDADLFEKLALEEEKESFIRQGTTIEKLLTSLQKNPNSSKTYREIALYLDLYPQSAPKIYEAIQNDINDSISAPLIAVLELSHSPKAQIILHDVVEDDQSSNINKLRSLITLGSMQKPKEQTLSLLVETSQQQEDQELADTALLALGSHAKTSSPYQEELLEQIRQNYHNDSSVSHAKTSLLAMQNAGVEHFLPELKEILNSSSVHLRLAAISTLSTLKDKHQKTKLLNRHLSQENDKRVQKLIKHYIKH